MTFVGRERPTQAEAPRVDEGADAEMDTAEIAAVLRRAERAGIDPARVLVALGLDLGRLAGRGTEHR